MQIFVCKKCNIRDEVPIDDCILIVCDINSPPKLCPYKQDKGWLPDWKRIKCGNNKEDLV